jgi:hypothetical protein
MPSIATGKMDEMPRAPFSSRAVQLLWPLFPEIVTFQRAGWVIDTLAMFLQIIANQRAGRHGSVLEQDRGAGGLGIRRAWASRSANAALAVAMAVGGGLAEAAPTVRAASLDRAPRDEGI